MEDLRINKALPGVLIPKGKSFYVVVDNLNLGKSGPFFLTPEAAIFYAFCEGNVDRSLIPIKINESEDLFSMFEQKSNKPVITIPMSPNIIDQLELPRTIGNVQRAIQPLDKIIPSNAMLRKITVPMESRNLKLGKKTRNVKYPGYEKVLLSISSNIDLIFDQELNLEKDYKLGFSKVKLTTIDLETSKEWINLNLDSSINFASSFSKYLERRNVIDVTPYISSIQKFLTPFDFPGVFISTPEQYFRQRTIFDIDWETVWELFLNLSLKFNSLKEIQTGFEKSGISFISNARDATNVHIPSTVLLNIISQLTSRNDVLSLYSVNRFFRSVCLSSIGQRILREKFQPPKADCFMRFPFLKQSTRNIFPGLPLPTVTSYGNFKGLWKVSYLFFNDDFNFGNREVLLDKLVATNPSISETNKRFTELDRQKMIRERVQRNAGQNPNSELVDIEKDVEPVKLSDSSMNNILRNTSSFMCFFAMTMSMSIKVTDLDIIVNENIHIRDKGTSFNENLIVKTRMENLVVRSAEDLLRNPSLQMHPTAKIIKALENIGMSGSWLHDTPVIPFFHNVEYASKLETLKRLEISRFKLKMGMESLENYGILGKRVINSLTIYRQGDLLAIIEIVTQGGYGDESIMVKFSRTKLSERTLSYLRKGLLCNVYCEKNEELKGGFVYLEDDDDERFDKKSGLVISSLVQIRYDKDLKTNVLDSKSSVFYYAQYMFLVSFIRTLVLNENADDINWNADL